MQTLRANRKLWLALDEGGRGTPEDMDLSSRQNHIVWIRWTYSSAADAKVIEHQEGGQVPEHH